MDNKTLLITGGSKGIGYHTVKLFAEKGWNVAFTYNNTKAGADNLLEELSQYSGKILAIKADMASSSDISAMFTTALATFGSVDAVVNNAGIAQNKLYTDLTDEDIDTMLTVNLRSVMLCCREAIKAMIKGSGGTIVNLSSIFGMVGGACEAHYSATKAGIIGLTKALALETSLSGIRVNCVAPGAIATPMNASLSPETIALIEEETPMGRLGRPEEIAEAIYFLCSDSSSFITGQVLSPNGGIVM